MKEKVNSCRIYDEDGFRKRAACLCVKNDDEDEILLVSSSQCSEKWVVPGGGIEPEELPEVAAIREVIEEAGVTGQLGRCLGTFEVNNTERKHRTVVYVMKVTKELDEWDDSRTLNRKRKWFKIDDALHQLRIHKPVQYSYVKLLAKNEETGTAASAATGTTNMTTAMTNKVSI